MGISRETKIRNKEGLHFRPIMQLVDLSSRFSATVQLHVEEREASSRSPMELLMLVATQGTPVRLEADGDDAEPALDAIIRLIENGFDET